MKKLLLTGLLAGFFMSAQAQEPPPAGIKPVIVRMQLFCADSFEVVMNVLAADFQEVPVAGGYLKEGAEASTTWTLFRNADNTSSTIVITKTTKKGEQSCLTWSGSSPSGYAFSIAPEPEFPEPKGTEM